jgi:hypothetical protein
VKKIVLLVVLAGLGWWYFIGARTLTEDGVRKHYDEQSAAMARFDTEALCAMLHDDYQAQEVSFTPAGAVKASVDRDQACDNIGAALEPMKKLSEIAGGQAGISFVNTISKVTLSDDGKTATVEGEGRFSMAGSLLIKSKYTEELVRTNGNILHLRSDAKSWVYSP